MENALNPRAVMGANNPPSEIELYAKQIADNNADIAKRAKELIDAAKKVPPIIEDEETAEKVTLYVKQLSECMRRLEEHRKAEKAPWDVRADMVQTYFKGYSTSLTKSKEMVSGFLDRYMKAKDAAEKQRLREEQQRQAEAAKALTSVAVELEKVDTGAAELALEDALMAETKANKYDAAIAAPSGRVAVRTETGATASLRTTWHGEVQDLNALDLEALRFYLPAAALQQAINAFIRSGGRELRGAKIESKSETVVK